MSLQVLDRRQKPCRVVSEHSQARITLAAKKIANRPGGVAVIDGQPVGGTAYGTSGSKAVEVSVGESIEALPVERASTGFAVGGPSTAIPAVEVVEWLEGRAARAVPSNETASGTSLSALVFDGIEVGSAAAGADMRLALCLPHTLFAALSLIAVGAFVKLVQCFNVVAVSALSGVRHAENNIIRLLNGGGA